jgi:hypothetical protein
MRTSFELEFHTGSYSDAKEIATSRISEFLQIGFDDIEDKVSIELKVKEHPEGEGFLVTAHGHLKNGFIFTPGS